MHDLRCQIRPLAEDDLMMLLSWRNAPEVRNYMLNQHVITKAEHLQWFAMASSDPSRRLLLVDSADLGPIGFVQFSGVAPDVAIDWGFYAIPGAPKGTGRRLGGAALAYAFEILEAHKVCGQALDFNDASIGFHLALGFCEEGRLRQQKKVGERYCDLICYGLLRQEWQQGLKDITP